VTDLVREASYPDFRDALREVWPELPESSVAQAWKVYVARVQRSTGAGAPGHGDKVPAQSLDALQHAFSKRDLPMRAGQAEELAIEILKGWS
jgi:hypothetical protein